MIEDDAYGALTLNGAPEPPAPLISMDEGENVIYLGSMSKTVAPGLRMGWVVGPVSVIERLADAKEQMDFGTSAITQQLTATYLSSGEWEKNVEKLRRVLTARRDYMVQCLRYYLADEISWSVPDGSYHLWCRTNLTARDVDVLEAGIRHGVLVMPGGVYGANRGYIRLNYARAVEEEIKEGIERLANTLRSLTE